MTLYTGEFHGIANGSEEALLAESITTGGSGANTPAINVYTDDNRNGIMVETSSVNGYPSIYVENTAYGGTVFGVYSKIDGTGLGPYSASYALYGVTGAPNGYGVYGEASGTGYGVYGHAGGSLAYGVYGQASGAGSTAVYGQATGTGSSTGVYGISTYGIGVAGASQAATGGIGVFGSCSANSSTVYGVYGLSLYGAGYAGYFSGNMNVANGNSTHSGSGTKSFRIDHPLDPENKFLLHACVESPELKTLYDGAGSADQNGELRIQLPIYFEALNTDHHYQLTAVGAPAPHLHIKDEVKNGQFTIAGAAPGQKVCWQVSGTRHDPTSAVIPFVAEVEKPLEHRGLYICPEAHGQPRDKGIDSAIHARMLESAPATQPYPPAPGHGPSRVQKG